MLLRYASIHRIVIVVLLATLSVDLPAQRVRTLPTSEAPIAQQLKPDDEIVDLVETADLPLAAGITSRDALLEHLVSRSAVVAVASVLKAEPQLTYDKTRVATLLELSSVDILIRRYDTGPRRGGWLQVLAPGGALSIGSVRLRTSQLPPYVVGDVYVFFIDFPFPPWMGPANGTALTPALLTRDGRIVAPESYPFHGMSLLELRAKVRSIGAAI
jgi:hypothetical protein